ncbi:hypothetical protein [Streptomyces sp. NBC_01190]|uniref:hypothetical protein n=1 Tax=Streptomyces sp. NBC_01190 TaxID=2903767 RepID=UPI003866E916|nr:hypothetical protein OG519_28900 [Streptomyces sp. NBC_01190]
MPDLSPVMVREYAVLEGEESAGRFATRKEAETYLSVHHDRLPDAHVATRFVRYGPWTWVDGSPEASPLDALEPSLREMIHAARDVVTRTASVARDPSLSAHHAEKLRQALAPWYEAINLAEREAAGREAHQAGSGDVES